MKNIKFNTILILSILTIITFFFIYNFVPKSSFSNEANPLNQSNKILEDKQEDLYYPQPTFAHFDESVSESQRKNYLVQFVEQNIPVKGKNVEDKSIDVNKDILEGKSSIIPKKINIINGQTVHPTISNWFSLFDFSLRSKDGMNWNLASYNNPFKTRYSFEATFFKDSIYLASGWNGGIPNFNNGNGCLADVWHSPSGSGWLPDTQNPPWQGAMGKMDGRFEHTLTTFQLAGVERMLLIGGGACTGNNIVYSDVWESLNGKNWNQIASATSQNIIGNRLGHVTFNLNGKLYIVGGYTTNGGFSNEVLSSTDGINWIIENTNAQFPERADMSGFILNNKMYIVGGYTQTFPGYGVEIFTDTAVQASLGTPGGVILSTLTYYNDVWSSSDGITWVQEHLFDTTLGQYVKELPHGLRGHSTDIINGEIYVVGGSDAVASYRSEVYKSTDGQTWTNIGNIASPLSGSMGLAEHGSVVSKQNFGSTILYNPPEVYFSAEYVKPNGNMELRSYFNNDNDPNTEVWYEYGYLPFSNTFYDFPYKTTKILNPNNGFFSQIIYPANKNLTTTFKADVMVKNSAGMRRLWGFPVVPCTAQTQPRIYIDTPHIFDTLNAGQSFNLKWNSCNIPATEAYNVGFGNGWVTTGVINDGNEIINLPPMNMVNATMLMVNFNPLYATSQYVSNLNIN